MRNGESEVQMVAHDPYGDSAITSFTVTVYNEPPLARDPPDTASILPDSTVGYLLTDFFHDPDDQTLSYEAHSNTPQVAESEIAGDTLVITGVYKGVASVTAVAMDSQDQTAELAFSVLVPNEGPTVINDPPLSRLLPDSVVEHRLMGYFHDPDDGLNIKFFAQSGDERVVKATTHDDVLSMVCIHKGRADVEVVAEDPEGAQAVLVFPAHVSNQPPARTDRSPSDVELLPNRSAAYYLPDYFTDPDDPQLSWSARSENPGVIKVRIKGDSLVVTGVRKGYSDISVTARDPEGEEVSLVFTGKVPNQPPRAKGTPPVTTIEVGETGWIDMNEPVLLRPRR